MVCAKRKLPYTEHGRSILPYFGVEGGMQESCGKHRRPGMLLAVVVRAQQQANHEPPTTVICTNSSSEVLIPVKVEVGVGHRL